MQIPADEGQSALGAFLKELRQRIPADARTLGSFERHALRYGRRVTQEEIAEAVDVSRGWYRMLEGGAKVRASAQLLDRLASVFDLTSEERVTLFALALPEMRYMQISSDARAVHQAFSWVRSTAKRLWVAPSETHAYVEISERLADWFDDALLVQWMRRDETGVWDRHSAAIRGSKLLQQVAEEICAWSFTRREHDKFMLFPQVCEAGAVGDTTNLTPYTRDIRIDAYTKHGMTTPDFLHARVRSRAGLIGGLAVVHDAGHDYSATERAVLGAMAELTSLALS